jgi:hypothetical protein
VDSVVEHLFDNQGTWDDHYSRAVAETRLRYRCTACGNLTRFDVVTTRRTRAFHHYTVGGDLTVEDEQVLAETVEEVACRWCGTGTAVEELTENEVAQG